MIKAIKKEAKTKEAASVTEANGQNESFLQQNLKNGLQEFTNHDLLDISQSPRLRKASVEQLPIGEEYSSLAISAIQSVDRIQSQSQAYMITQSAPSPTGSHTLISKALQASSALNNPQILIKETQHVSQPEKSKSLLHIETSSISDNLDCSVRMHHRTLECADS